MNCISERFIAVVLGGVEREVWALSLEAGPGEAQSPVEAALCGIA